MELKQVIQVDLQDAWLSIMRHWFRSLLSTLGIAIGVASLVTMLSISSGAKDKALERAKSLGINTIRIENLQKENSLVDKSLANISHGLNEGDLKYLTQKHKASALAAGFIKDEAIKFSFRSNQELATLIRASSDWIKIEELSIQVGRFWNQLDYRKKQRVCVAGSEIAVRLGVKLGEYINFAGTHCKIIGIQKAKGSLLTEGTGLSTIDFDNSIMMPILQMDGDRIVSGSIALDGITLSFNVKQQSELYEYEKQVRQVILQRHGNVQDFNIIVPEKIIDQVRKEKQVFSVIMGGIAGLSLLVGGVGIMNIMLANIAEQVREIGLRIALGATAKRIVLLFVVTSVLLCIVGAVLGVFFGVILAISIMIFVDWPISFSFASILLGPIFAIVVGILFGIYPGITAISCDPATSLKEY